MQTRYFTTHGYGNLGNQLYYALHAETMRRESGDRWVFVPTGYSRECGFIEASCKLNLGEYVGDGIPELRIDDTYLQEFGKHFTIEDVEKFVSNTMMFADCSQIEKPQDIANDVLIVIRNGDYLWKQYEKFNYFDRYDFFDCAFKHLPKDMSVGTLCVSSDDTELCKGLYGDVFRELFGQRVKYLPIVKPWSALLRNSFYKYQITTNTTFGYWGAFISGVRYQQGFGNVIVPWGFSTDEMNGNRNSPRWFTVDCKTVRGQMQ